MADDLSFWAALLRWIGANPEQLALGLVLGTGAWRWIREAIHDAKGIAREETLVETLLKERNEVWRENQVLRAELRELRRKNGSGNGHEPPATTERTE